MTGRPPDQRLSLEPGERHPLASPCRSASTSIDGGEGSPFTPDRAAFAAAAVLGEGSPSAAAASSASHAERHPLRSPCPKLGDDALPPRLSDAELVEGLTAELAGAWNLSPTSLAAESELAADAALASRLQRAGDEVATYEDQRRQSLERRDSMPPSGPAQQQAGQVHTWQDSAKARALAAEVLMEGILEKKPIKGFGMVERQLGAGWRNRRFVLRPRVLEWHHGDVDDEKPPTMRLDPDVTSVRAGGDAGDDVSRCLAVDGGSQTLVMRATDESERDVWLRAVGRCLEKLKAAAFEAAVAQAGARLETVLSADGPLAHRRAATREGVQLLMERFYDSASGISAAAEESFDERSLEGLAESLCSCLLTRQAETRIREGERGVLGAGEEELRQLQVFPWHPLVAEAIEQGVWSLLGSWGSEVESLSEVASFFDHVMGISEPHASKRPPTEERWARFRTTVHSTFMGKVVALAVQVPAPLASLIYVLTEQYGSLQTSDEDGTPAVIVGVGARCEVVRRMNGASTKPLLLRVSGGVQPETDLMNASVDDAWRRHHDRALLPPADSADADCNAADEAASAPAPEAAGRTSSFTMAGWPPPVAPMKPSYFFFKLGDDLRQDLATLLLLDEMNVMWKAAGLSCFTKTYRVYPTDERAGFIEALDNAMPVAKAGEFAYSQELHESAVGAFTAGFVLGLADRHQDNMLLVGPRNAVFAHIDFGYVAGSRPWFDANLLPVPERFYRCCSPEQWSAFADDVMKAFTVLQESRVALCTVAAAFAEPLTRVGYPAYINSCLVYNTPQNVRKLVKDAPSDFARRFKNIHHRISHAGL